VRGVVAGFGGVSAMREQTAVLAGRQAEARLLGGRS